MEGAVHASGERYGLDVTVLQQHASAARAKGASDDRVAHMIAREAMMMRTDSIEYENVARDALLHLLHAGACTGIRQVAHEARDLVSGEYVSFCERHSIDLDAMLEPSRDELFGAEGLLLLMSSYLWRRSDDSIAETPQLMLMRVAIATSGWDLSNVLESYELMSRKLFTHATPTIFNAGLARQQMSSCYVIHPGMGTEGILNAQHDAGLISMNAGGLGMSVHSQSFHGGLVPVLRAYESTTEIAEQSGGKRHGRMCVYIEPSNPYIDEVLNLHKSDGSTADRCHNIFTAIWVPDEFMRRVRDRAQWTYIVSDAQREELANLHGAQYDARYAELESAHPEYPRTGALDLMERIARAQVETGRPFLLYKDHVNGKSNQSHMGTIKSSNLCTEIMIHTDKDHTAVCNLASLVLGAYVRDGAFDLELLGRAVRRVVRNLNAVIDANYYPTERARASNTHGRPIGVGVQGLQDVFFMLELPFDSEEARILNRTIFESIYFWAAWESTVLHQEGVLCPAYDGSPASRGILNHEMWGVQDAQLVTASALDWGELRVRARSGMANTLLVALMPTASTSIIMGSCAESIEPVTYHIMVRKLLSGESMFLNRHLYHHLKGLGLWNQSMLGKIIGHNGQIGKIAELPESTRHLFRTSWEISLNEQIKLTTDRAPFVDQSQSTNVFMREPTINKLLTYHMRTWENGLKTSMYYLRQQPVQTATQFAACTLGCDSCSA
jgi:ribonucleoside-diphosphate reductase alpha chain